MRFLPLLVAATLPWAAAAQSVLTEVQKAPHPALSAELSAADLGHPASPDAPKSGELVAGKAADGQPSDFDADKIAGNEPAAPPLTERQKAPSPIIAGEGVIDLGEPANPPVPKTADLAVSHAEAVETIYDDDKIAGNEPAPMPFDETFDSGPLSERQKYPSELAEGTDPADFGLPATDATKTDLAVSKAEIAQPNIEDNDKIAGNPYVEPPLLPRDKAPSVLPDPVADADMGQPTVAAPKVELVVSKVELGQPNIEDYDKIAGNPVVAPPMAERSKAPSYEMPFDVSDAELGLLLAPGAAEVDIEISKTAEAVITTYDEDKIEGNEYVDPFADEYGMDSFDFTPPEEMVTAIRALLDDPATRTATLDGIAARGLAPAAITAPFQSFVAALYDVPAVRDGLANEIAIVAFDVGLTPETPLVTGRMAAEYMASFGDAEAARGIARLPVAEQRGYLADMLRIADALPVDQCGPFLDGTMAALPMRQVLLAGLADRPVAEVEAALIRQAAAVVAEMQADPAIAELAPAELDRAQVALGTSAIAAIDATENPTALLSAYGDPLNADPADLCAVHRLVLQGAVDATGPDADLLVRYLVQYGWAY